MLSVESEAAEANLSDNRCSVVLCRILGRRSGGRHLCSLFTKLDSIRIGIRFGLSRRCLLFGGSWPFSWEDLGLGLRRGGLWGYSCNHLRGTGTGKLLDHLGNHSQPLDNPLSKLGKGETVL